jgi:hypothetical protein
MTVPEAIQIAKRHLVEVMPDLASSSAAIELDELETPPNDSKWRFTFTVVQPLDSKPDMTLFELLRSRRSTKAVVVDGSNGDLIAIHNQAA